MSLAVACFRQFHAGSRLRGEAYLRQKRVSLQSHDENHGVLQVRGSAPVSL